jgi:hypothetical protein
VGRLYRQAFHADRVWRRQGHSSRPSYPYWGYGLLLIIFVCMMLALLIRRKQLREGQAE